MILEQIEALKSAVDRPYRQLCPVGQVGYATLMRWRLRQERGEALVRRPGPQPAGPLDLATLQTRLLQLGHGRRRSAGASQLYQQVRIGISRRQFGQRLAATRRQVWRAYDASLRRILWLVPGAVWSIDPTELLLAGTQEPQRLRFLPAMDLGSRYKFAPWVGESIPGLVVADHLEKLFCRYGPPLVLKRDEGSNLNDEAVDELLARWLVIPLNSPRHYPRYNGVMERAQREFKAAFLVRWSQTEPGACSPAAVAQWTVDDLNARPRRCLQARSANAFFAGAKRNLGAYTERRRREAFDTINALVMQTVAEREVSSQPQLDAARRRAVETWLQREGIIALAQPKPVTQFP